MEEKKMNFKLCDICKSQATLFCSDCECVCNYYCDICYKFVHDKKININHKKEKIDFFVPIETKCPVHKEVDYNLFCLDEKGNNFYIIYFNSLNYRTLLFNVSFYEFT